MEKIVEVKVVKAHEDAVIPKQAKAGDAGFDFYSVETVTIEAGETKLISTGLKFAIPLGKELQVRPRSGMSLKTKIRISNSPGTIDSGYRGVVGIIVDNIGKEAFTIEVGDRIAQGVITDVYKGVYTCVEDLDETDRGDGGFGSTGTK